MHIELGLCDVTKPKHSGLHDSWISNIQTPITLICWSILTKLESKCLACETLSCKSYRLPTLHLPRIMVIMVISNLIL